jgi:hypothetical protein
MLDPGIRHAFATYVAFAVPCQRLMGTSSLDKPIGRRAPAESVGRHPRLSRRRVACASLRPGDASDCDVGDHWKMIGNTASAMVDEARPHCLGRPAEDAVEVKKWTPGRKCRMPGPARELPRERSPQRSWPEPFVEVAKHDRGHCVRPCDRHQSACLASSLAERQPEMRSDQSECAGGHCNFHLNGAARLALRVGMS